MSNVINDAREALEDELCDLDLPMIDIAVILLTVGDALDIDPMDLLRAYRDDIEGIDLPRMKESHGAQGVDLMVDLLDEAIESSTQLPHIMRALEVYEGLANL